MRTEHGKHWLERLRKQVILFAASRVLMLSLAIALPAGVLLNRFFYLGAAGYFLPFILFFVLFSAGTAWWKVSLSAVSRLVDFHLAEAEESSGLLLKTPLTFLEQLQVSKLDRALPSLPMPGVLWRPLKLPAIFLLLGIVCGFLIAHAPERIAVAVSRAGQLNATAAKTIRENIPAQISSYRVTIQPPAYTGKSIRSQQQFTINAETGAVVKWEISTSAGLRQLSLLFNDHEKVMLKAMNRERTSWSASKIVDKPGFYQLLLNDQHSDLYQIEITADQPVVIRITKPAQHSTIDVGQPQQLNLSVLMNDDYGISNAWISATMASGKGEAVSFKEKKILFNMPFRGKRKVAIDKLIGLKDLGMKPGDELYYYVSAVDNHGQQSRSDMYFVSIQDTTELMSMAGIDNGVSLVLEYFRSERQLIIDTEKLLKEKANITETEFKQRSNDLGIDQKMLRLRYGKFLGEESETNIGAGHDADHDHGHAEAGSGQFGDVHEIMDQYAHKHDNAEDATFFEPALKAQLKATLTEMWGAELRLRTYLPQEALPYEYKALRLLKDLQQKSRAYVAKTTVKTSPLKPEKRLTGELTAIRGGDTKSMAQKGDTRIANLQTALNLLEEMKTGTPAAQNDAMNILLSAQRELLQAAAVSPRRYLAALKDLKKIVSSGSGTNHEIGSAEKGIALLLGKEVLVPHQQPGSSASALAKSYFKHLTTR